MAFCRNYNKRSGEYLMFLPRVEDLELGRYWEAYKLDTHVAASMRKEDRLLPAEQAADAARLYLQVMHTIFGTYSNLSL